MLTRINYGWRRVRQRTGIWPIERKDCRRHLPRSAVARQFPATRRMAWAGKPEPTEGHAMHVFRLYRHDPDTNNKPRMPTIELQVGDADRTP